jgi:hypothetical protein
MRGNTALRLTKLNRAARAGSIALGAGLAAAALRFGDGGARSWNAAVCGIAIATLAVVAWIRYPWLRAVNATLAMWVFWSAILWQPATTVLLWSEWLLSLGVLVCAFVPLWSVAVDQDGLDPYVAPA